MAKKTRAKRLRRRKTARKRGGMDPDDMDTERSPVIMPNSIFSGVSSPRRSAASTAASTAAHAHAHAPAAARPTPFIMITPNIDNVDLSIDDKEIKPFISRKPPRIANHDEIKKYSNPDFYRLNNPSSLIDSFQQTLDDLQPLFDAHELIYISIGGMKPPTGLINNSLADHIYPTIISSRFDHFADTKILCIAIDLFPENYVAPEIENPNHTIVCINATPFANKISEEIGKIIGSQEAKQEAKGIRGEPIEQLYVVVEQLRINFSCIPTGMLVAAITNRLRQPAQNVMICNFVRLINTSNVMLMLSNMLPLIVKSDYKDSIYEWIANTNLILKILDGKIPIIKNFSNNELILVSEKANPNTHTIQYNPEPSVRRTLNQSDLNELKQIYTLRSTFWLNNNVNNIAHSFFALRNMMLFNADDPFN